MPPEPLRGATPFADIRALPVPVQPIDGETSRSYFDRLVAANALTTETLWGHLRTLHQKLPVKRNLHAATTELEALGGLPEQWFIGNRVHHLLPLRCPHNSWGLRICITCSTAPAERPGCRRCSAGQPTQVATATGAICLRHRRWMHNDVDLDVSHLPRHLIAEKRFRTYLVRRGIALGTGELDLARTLLADWSPSRSPGDGPSRNDADGRFFELYPEIVQLTIALTDPEYTALLMHPRWSPCQHAVLLTRTITNVIGQTLSDFCTATVFETVYQNCRAVKAAYSMIGIRKRKCCNQRAFCAAAYTHRACLLRHLNAKDLPRKMPSIKARPAISVKATIRYQQTELGPL